MKVVDVKFNTSSFGITRKSLWEFRNILAGLISDKILVVRVNTGGITCGFFIFEEVSEGQVTAYWTGDGFRTDGGGEGGRGHAMAMNVLRIFGVNYLDYYDDDNSVIKAWDNLHSSSQDEQAIVKAITDIAQKVIGQFEDEKFQCAFNEYPSY